MCTAKLTAMCTARLTASLKVGWLILLSAKQ
jgi:hypothetical protein